MKKTIIVIILAIYVASIFAVNFFGLEVKIFDGTDYVESIQVDTVTLQNENAVEIEPSRSMSSTVSGRSNRRIMLAMLERLLPTCWDT